MTPLEKLRSQIEISPEGCWLWTGHVDRRDGYGVTYDPVGHRNIGAHRASFIWHGGIVPQGMVVDHKCRVRRCVNPDHLQAISNKENVLSGEGVTARNAVATHCIRGHEFTGDNVKVRDDGARVCQTCRRASQLRYRARRKASRPKTVRPLGHDEQMVLDEVGATGCTAHWIAVQRHMPRLHISTILRRLKRRGLVEHDGVAWRPTAYIDHILRGGE